MKKVIMFFLLTAFVLSLNASMHDDIMAGMYYQQDEPVGIREVQLPADFDFEKANQELLQARESGNIEKANLLSLQINTYWLENRVETTHPTTHGMGESNESIMYRNNEENSHRTPPSSPDWWDDVRIDPRNGIRGTDLVSLSTGELYCISKYYDSGDDCLLIRRSVDGGLTWTTFWDFNFGSFSVTSPTIVECHDTLIISYVLYHTDYYTWTIVSTTGNALNAIYVGSASGHDDGAIVDFSVCTDGATYPGAYVYATWAEQWGGSPFDSTRIMFARSSELNVGTWEIGPDRLAYSTTGSNNIYFDYTRIVHGQGSNILLAAHLHPNAYPGTYDEYILGFLSTNFGLAWGGFMAITPFNNGIDEYQPSIAGSHTNPNWVCLTTISDIPSTYFRINNYYSTDNCANWTGINWIGPEENFFPDVWVDDNSTAFFGASRKDLSSTEEVRYKQGDINDPTSWTTSLRVNDDDANLSNSYGPSVAYNYASGDAIMAWTNFVGGYSIWFDDQSWSVGVEETPVEISGGMIVLAPNPSKDFATLSYSVVNEGLVNISIYDASGRMVENLLDAVVQTGQHSLTIDNENLASGFYLLRIVTPDGVNTENMRVVK